jgi:biopolymer transport protein ExbB
MYALLDAYDQVLIFIERGGPILLWIGLLVFVMWTLIFERLMYFRVGFPRLAGQIMARWEARRERKSWEAHQVRQSMVADAKINLQSQLSLIKAMVALCPLLGLLGTVTGMMEVFDVMAIAGTGSARNMASGISKATIPTMAGMVGALTGVFFTAILDRQAKMKKTHLEDELTFDH